jgi:hypothetical protein
LDVVLHHQAVHEDPALHVVGVLWVIDLHIAVAILSALFLLDRVRIPHYVII